ncbi:Uncharacterised protein [Streptococcus pneumoniae]|nr:Uncharacterised protein [Streptococcus pneumoniae]
MMKNSCLAATVYICCLSKIISYFSPYVCTSNGNLLFNRHQYTPCFLFRSQTNLFYHYLLETSVNRDHLVQNMLKLPVGFFHQ